MPDAPPPAANQAEPHRYLILDSETQGLYKIVSRTPRSPAELDQLIQSVVRDEGRVKPGATRIVFL